MLCWYGRNYSIDSIFYRSLKQMLIYTRQSKFVLLFLLWYFEESYAVLSFHKILYINGLKVIKVRTFDKKLWVRHHLNKLEVNCKITVNVLNLGSWNVTSLKGSVFLNSDNIKLPKLYILISSVTTDIICGELK